MKTLAVAASVVLVAGCGKSSPAKTEKTEWPGPPKADAGGRLPVAGYNAFLAGDGREFARSPITAVTEFLRLDKTSAADTSVEATSPGEVRHYSEVVATLDGLLDDSVRAARYTVELHRQANSWRVSAADWAQRCQPGRGHQDFSSKPCV